MTLIFLFELSALVFSVFVLGRGLLRKGTAPPPTSTILLLGLIGIQAVVHLSDALEWMGMVSMDQLGDDLRVLIPLMWMLSIFSLHRQALAEQVQSSSEQLAFLLREGPLAACVFEECGKVLAVSNGWENHTGYTQRASVGQRWESAPGVPERLIQDVSHALALSHSRSNYQFGSQYPLQTKWCGREEWIEWQAQSHKLRDGTPCITLLVQFVTERYQRELAVKQQTSEMFHRHRVEMVGLLAATVAHDLNNLLQMITGHAEILPENSSDSSVRLARLGILDAAEQASQLVHSLNGLARSKGAVSEVDLTQLLSSTAKLVDPILPATIQLQLDVPKERMKTCGDRSRLQQLLMNLIINARDAMLPMGGGTLTLHGTLAEERVIIEVRDTGPGIPDRLQERIFDKFFTTKSSSDGTGLGLALVRAIAEEHKAKLELDSAPGQGTVFRIDLPRAKPRVSTTPPDSNVTEETGDAAANSAESRAPQGKDGSANPVRKTALVG